MTAWQQVGSDVLAEKDITYDANGNILTLKRYGSDASLDDDYTYIYSGNALTVLSTGSGSTQSLSYDSNGNLVADSGKALSSATYNELNLPESAEVLGTPVCYLYLADGTKLAAMRNGTGYIYCGSMVYRGIFTGASSLAAFEGTGFSAGRIVKNGSAIVPTYHVNDYLCSVRVVTDASGEVLERNDYSGFGKRLESSTGSLNRYRFSGKEEQSQTVPGWQDFGARMYDPDLARWTTPDPLADQYPGISPYAYCAGDPVNFVDPEGEAIDVLWDVASIGLGVKSLIDNVKSGNVRGAIGDGAGIVVDAVAAMIPFVPGGVGYLKAGQKVVNAVDAGLDLLRLTDELKDFEKAADFGVDTYKNLRKQVLSKYGKNSGLEVHHLIEQRFAEKLGVSASDMPSIVLTKAEHKKFTDAWRKEIGYNGSSSKFITLNVDQDKILDSARKIYADYPEILKVIEEAFK